MVAQKYLTLLRRTSADSGRLNALSLRFCRAPLSCGAEFQSYTMHTTSSPQQATLPLSVGQSTAPAPFRFSQCGFSRSLHLRNRTLEQCHVLGFIRRRIYRQWGLTEVVGSWVWVHRTCTVTEQERSFLFELGFHWSARREAWQHPYGVSHSSSRQQFVRYFPAEEESRSPEFAPHC